MTMTRRRTNGNRQPAVHFGLTYADYWNFNKYAFLHTPWLPVYFAGLLAVALALMVFDARQHNDAVMAFVRNFLVSGAIVAFIGSAVYFRYRGNARRIFSENPQLAGRTTVTLDDRGAHVENEAGVLEVEWRMFRRIVQTRDSIYLLYGLGLATIIPKRAFPTEAEARAFFQFAREAWEQAMRGTRG